MAELYRQKVADLAQALEHPKTRTEAAETIRGLIDAIALTPADAFRLKPEATGNGVEDAMAVSTRAGRRPHPGAMTIELKGNLAAMLTMATRLRARESGGATAGFGPDFAGPQNATRSPETGDLELQIAMVAGACNQRYLQLSLVAA